MSRTKTIRRATFPLILTAMAGALATGVTTATAAEVDPEAPVVSLAATSTVVEEEDGIAVATASDPQGEELTYTWSVSDEAIAYVLNDDPSSPSTTFAGLDGPGSFQLSVTVSDGTRTATDTVTVQVTNRAPWIEVPDGLHYYVDAGQTFEFGVGPEDARADEPLNCTIVPEGRAPMPTQDNCFVKYDAPQWGGVYHDKVVVDDGDGGVSQISWYLHVDGPAAPEDPEEPTSDYTWGGFVGPVDDVPTVNTVKAGASVPVMFTLGGDFGLDIFAEGSPASQRHGCDSAGTADALESTATAGQNGLSYDASTQRYSYIWKTQKSWSGQCRSLVLTMDDGTEHVAEFQFR